MARYQLAEDARICDLDDPQQLAAWELRPSDVVTRDYARSRAWARRIHEQGTWAGVRWWSYYDSKWASFGLWDLAGLAVEEITLLTLEDPALAEASRTIVRRIVTKKLRAG
jgi:hypothetical protein